MPIPMKVTDQFLADVVAGSVVRYGCILKKVSDGRIVGHLKEVGSAAMQLSAIPLNPLAAGASALAQVGQWLDTHAQLQQVRLALDHLKLISTVGAVASVAGLGVSVAGFGLVLRRLDRLEQNLNLGMQTIRAEVEKLHLKFDLLEMAELRSAWQRLEGAERTGRPGRADELLREADRVFQKYRNYYFELISAVQPLRRPQLSLAQARELYGRYFACAQAELEANFRLNDFEHWFSRHESIGAQLKGICSVPAEVVSLRAGALGLLSNDELQDLRDQVRMTRDFCQESKDRVLTADEEVCWLQGQQIAPKDYLAEFQQGPTQGLVLVPHDTPGE
jgi:hypothetical protein